MRVMRKIVCILLSVVMLFLMTDAILEVNLLSNAEAAATVSELVSAFKSAYSAGYLVSSCPVSENKNLRYSDSTSNGYYINIAKALFDIAKTNQHKYDHNVLLRTYIIDLCSSNGYNLNKAQKEFVNALLPVSIQNYRYYSGSIFLTSYCASLEDLIIPFSSMLLTINITHHGKTLSVEFFAETDYRLGTIQTSDRKYYYYSCWYYNDCISVTTSGFPVLPDGYEPDGVDRYRYANHNSNVAKSSYIRAYGKYKGEELYKTYEKKSHGICYGMAGTTTAFLKYDSLLKSFVINPNLNNSATSLYDIRYESTSALLGGHTGLEYIGYAHLLQYDKNVIAASDRTKNDMRGLVNAVKNYVNGVGEQPIIILSKYNVFNQKVNRHAVAVSGYKENDESYIILVDDSNDSLNLSEIIINKSFSYWEFDAPNTFYSLNNGEFLYYFPADTVYNMGIMWESSVSPFLSNNNLLVSIEGGISSDCELLEIEASIDSAADADTSKKLYWANDDVNEVEMTAEADDTEILVADENSAISVLINSKDDAIINVDDDGNNFVDIAFEESKEIDISFFSINPDGKETKTSIKGLASEKNVIANETAKGIEVSGAESVTVMFESDSTVVTRSIDNKNGEAFDIVVDENDVSIDCRDKHTDSDSDGVCDNCEARLEAETPEEPSVPDESAECDHFCHSENAFWAFVWKIYNFLMKLFSMERYCSCGAAHY